MVPVTTVYLIRHSDVENPQSVLYGHLDGRSDGSNRVHLYHQVT